MYISKEQVGISRNLKNGEKNNGKRKKLMDLVSYKNNVYSVFYKKQGSNWKASITIYGAEGIGETKEDSLVNLKMKLQELQTEQNTINGKPKILLG